VEAFKFLQKAQFIVLDGLADFFGDRKQFFLFSQGIVYKCRQLMQLRWAANDIDGGMFEQAIAEALCHTTDDANDECGPGLFCMFKMAEVREDFCFRVLADGAGVNQYDIGGIEESVKVKFAFLSALVTRAVSSLFIWQPKVRNKTFIVSNSLVLVLMFVRCRIGLCEVVQIFDVMDELDVGFHIFTSSLYIVTCVFFCFNYSFKSLPDTVGNHLRQFFREGLH